jgi:hypothetical protein
VLLGHSFPEMPDVDAIVAALSAADSPLRREGATVFADFLLGRRMDALVPTDALVATVQAAMHGEAATRFMEAYPADAWARLTARVADGTVLGDVVPEAARPALERLLAELERPDGAWLTGAIDDAKLRELFAPVLQELLLSFSRKVYGLAAMPEAPGASVVGKLAGRLRKRVEKGAEQFSSTVAGAMAGAVATRVGEGLEERFQKAARDYSQRAVDEVRSIVARRLESEEGRALVAGIRRVAFDRVLEAPLSAILADLETSIPAGRVAEVAPHFADHLGALPLYRSAVDEEVAAFFEAEGAKTAGTLLAEYGLLEEVRAGLVPRLDALGSELAQEPAFQDWLGRLIDS